MKWKNKPRRLYKQGHRILVKKFAFFPTSINDEKIWLESYYCLNCLVMHYQYWGRYLKWKPIEMFLTINDLKQYLQKEKDEKRKTERFWKQILGEQQ